MVLEDSESAFMMKSKESMAEALLPPQEKEETSPGCKLFVFILFTQVVQALMSYDGGATQFCTDSLAQDGWSAIELGLLGAMDKFGQVATAFLVGELLMRYNAKLLLAVGLFWKALSCFVFAMLQQQPMTAWNKLLMMFAKLGMGITEALVSVWATVWVTANAPPDARARWQGFAGTSAGIGSGVGSGAASLWSPIYAFFVQAVFLWAIWLVLLFTPQVLLRFASVPETDDDEQPHISNPVSFLAEVAAEKSHWYYARTVFIESVRLPGHYLDASENPEDHGFKLRITRGEPSTEEFASWAQFKMIEVGGDKFSFESMRIPGHFLDATDERGGIMEPKERKRIRLSYGDCTEHWSHFKLIQVGDDVWNIESIKHPGHYIDATGEKLVRGTKVRLTKGNPLEEWAQFRLRQVDDRPDSFPVTSLDKPPETSFLGRVKLVLSNRVWLWTAMAISLSCFVTSGISFIWQNTLHNVWGFNNQACFTSFFLSTGIGGLIGVALGPKLFDGYLKGFATPKGKAVCLGWCATIMFVASICSTVCFVLMANKVVTLVRYNHVEIVYWHLVVLITCVFIMFICINSIVGTLYGINTASTDPELRTFAAGLTVSFQNVFGYAFGPLLPGAVASLAGRVVIDIWPDVHWDPQAVRGATYAAGMGWALLATWLLFLFTSWGAVRARIENFSRAHAGTPSRRSDRAITICE